ncbi:MAG: hypothetical protein V1856_03570 [Candidatus Liptonbacteria bacterium]
MTIIRPERSRPFFVLIMSFLGAMCLACTIWLVWSYLDLHNTQSSISQLQGELEKIRVQTAELKEKEFSLLDSENLSALAASRQLVKDKEPQYITNTSQWLSVVSRH